MRRMILAVTLALAAPAGAQAASVDVESFCDRYMCFHVARYTADAGERNELESTRAEPGGLRIHDAGARGIRVGPECAHEDPSTVVCAKAGGVMELLARLGDRDDRARLEEGSVHGGRGDDTIVATEGAELTGGPGRDVLTGSPYADRFRDRDGREPARDRYLGKGGADAVDYSGRRTAVRIDLRRGRAGEDRLSSIASATGGSGADRLIGTAGPNGLIGGAGDDVILGGAGRDDIIPGRGADIVRAGAGADRVASDAREDRDAGNRISCGSGRDMVDIVGPRDLLVPGCERLALGETQAIDNFPQQFPRGPGAVVLRLVNCCDGASATSAALTAGGVRIGSVRRRNRRHMRLRLGAQGWAMLQLAGRLEVQVMLRFGPPLRQRAGVRLELRLRR